MVSPLSDRVVREVALQNIPIYRHSRAGGNLPRHMKASAAAGGAGLALSGLPFKALAKNHEEAEPAPKTEEVWSSCMVNCLSRCPIKYHVEDGVIVRTETDNYGNDEYGEHQVRACLRERSSRPAYITQGYGAQRHYNGEQSVRAIAMLPILTGNVAIKRGNAGHTEGSYSSGYPTFPQPANPVKTTISVYSWMKMITDGVNMTATRDGVRGKDKLGVPLKFMWNYAGNVLVNQHSDINNTNKVLADESLCEMIVVIDNHMTSSARYADILLPDVTTPEREDIAIAGNPGPMDYRIFCSQAIKPMFECKNIYEICTGLAKRLGIEKEYTEGRNEREWLAHIHELAGQKIADLPSFDDFRERGIIKFPNPGEPPIAFKEFREDPENNPLKTPSGKIEIYSQKLAEAAATWELPEGDEITALPQYVKNYQGHDDPMAEQFPLQLTGYHIKSRVHSSYHWTGYGLRYQSCIYLAHGCGLG